MKKIIGFSIWMLFIAGSLTLFTQCDDNKDNVPDPQVILVVDNNNGSSSFDLTICQTNISNLPLETLSQAEKDGILFMREEEKLARDVYQKFYDQWATVIFSNINSSEETHFEAMLMLIEKYNLTDPATGNTIGVFANTTLQEIYDILIIQGDISEIEALKAGALVEEVDIMDLNNQLDNVVDNQDVELVYRNLLAASRNHFRAFVNHLSNQGVGYVPQYLSQSEFDDIINSDWEHGYHHGG